MKKQKLLKLTKLTVANLGRVKGGLIGVCKCDIGLGDGEYNRDNLTAYTCHNPCVTEI